ncbi:hypothetical protein P0E77_13965 [Enterococcus faecalis]|uniref:hypothetical protein n=1 Tax=Enterococcus faecalis TaxID=1351 RepID=UPI0025B19D15|nr:hypothetical protein [Enterococcus faecalis]MDN3104189.1 hypothetical protein [Enterococcus faecalis]
MIGWLKSLMNIGDNTRTISDAYDRGRSYAWTEIREAGEEHEVETMARLRDLSGGQFNKSERENEFDRGIRDVCDSVIEDLGHP